MPKIGIVYGMENSFPAALVDRINGKQIIFTLKIGICYLRKKH